MEKELNICSCHAGGSRELSPWQRKIELQKWAVLGGRFGQPSGICWGLDGDGPRFRPPEGSFVNFLAQMTNTVLRSRREKRCATAQPAPAARIALPSRNTRAIEISTVLSHDLRWIPTRLAKQIYVRARSKGGYRGGKTGATIHNFPTDRPFDSFDRLD